MNRLLSCYVKRIAEAGSNNLVCAIKEVVAMVSSNLLVSLPYLLSFLHQSSDRQIVRDVRRAFAIGEREKLVLVTDTLVEVNGVSRSIRKMIAEARRRNIDFTVVTCLGREQRERLCSRPEFRELVECGQLRIFESAVERAALALVAMLRLAHMRSVRVRGCPLVLVSRAEGQFFADA